MNTREGVKIMEWERYTLIHILWKELQLHILIKKGCQQNRDRLMLRKQEEIAHLIS